MAGGGAVKGRGVKLAERVVRGIGKIDDDEVEAVGIRIDPGKRIGVDDMDARREQANCG